MINFIKRWLDESVDTDDPFWTRGEMLDLRWTIWKMKWFPYRTYTILNDDEFADWGINGGDLPEIIWSPPKWNRPGVLRRKRG